MQPMKQIPISPITGLHHITAVAGDPQRNIDFYEQVLGQRMVKKTINFDDPSTYHFYFADYRGSPGTLITFFPWSQMRRGRRGTGETTAMSYAVPSSSLAWWQARLRDLGVATSQMFTRFEAKVLPFTDPDGMTIELVADDRAREVDLWGDGPVPPAHALRGFHGVTLTLADVTPTARLLTEIFGYTFVAQEGDRYRYQGDPDTLAPYVDLWHRPELSRAQFGVGSIHHIAFRVVDDAEQEGYQTALNYAGLGVTPVRERNYFRSIYFREPGGVLFEMATNGPGMAIDEPLEALGQTLRLPPWLENDRAAVESRLPVVTRRSLAAAGA